MKHVACTTPLQSRHEAGMSAGTHLALMFLCTVVIAMIVLAFTVYSAKQEAETYNRLTGANVSTWDALWVELRVDSPPR